MIIITLWYAPDAIESYVYQQLKKKSNESENYKDRFSAHPNELVNNLLNTADNVRRLKRSEIMDLMTRFD